MCIYFRHVKNHLLLHTLHFSVKVVKSIFLIEIIIRNAPKMYNYRGLVKINISIYLLLFCFQNTFVCLYDSNELKWQERSCWSCNFFFNTNLWIFYIMNMFVFCLTVHQFLVDSKNLFVFVFLNLNLLQ